jgi:hypothetical protein
MPDHFISMFFLGPFILFFLGPHPSPWHHTRVYLLIYEAFCGIEVAAKSNRADEATQQSVRRRSVFLRPNEVDICIVCLLLFIHGIVGESRVNSSIFLMLQFVMVHTHTWCSSG